MQERLDRALASPDWRAAFPNALVEVVASSCSDHLPLWICVEPSNRPPPKMFRFEACWNVVDDCAGVIKNAWGQDVDGQMLWRLLD